MADGSSIIPTLFGSSSSIPEFPGVSGGDAIPVPARRNSRTPSVSKLILKSVARVLEGLVLTARVDHFSDGTFAVVTEHEGASRRRNSALRIAADRNTIETVYTPAGIGVTYHLPATALVEALTRPAEAADLVEAYRDMLSEWDAHSRGAPRDLADQDDFKDAVLRVTDELYYWLRYGPADVDAANDRISEAEVTTIADCPASSRSDNLAAVAQALTDPDEFDRFTVRAELVDVAPNWRTELLERARGEGMDNQAVGFAPARTWNGLRFRSQSEAPIAQALDCAGVLYLPNCKARLGASGERQNREADFLVSSDGKWGILEVDGEPFRPPSCTAQDHERDRLFRTHGILVVEHFDAAECFSQADRVVRRYLGILGKT